MGSAYDIGRSFGRLGIKRIALIVGLLALLLWLRAALTTTEPERRTPPIVGPSAIAALSPASAAEAARAAELAECKRERPQLIAAYEADFKDGRFWPAASSIRKCAGVLVDPDLKKMLREAEVKSHLADINSPKTSVRDRAQAMQMLARDYPDVGAKYAAQAAQLIARADREEAAAVARQKKSQGVRIGMTPEDVIASSWGKPQRINRTTTALGEREQWVYGGNNYLYFTDGKLTTIQN